LQNARELKQLPNAHQAAIHNAWTYRSNHWKKPLAYGGKLDRSKNVLMPFCGIPHQAPQRAEANEECLVKPVQKLPLQ